MKNAPSQILPIKIVRSLVASQVLVLAALSGACTQPTEPPPDTPPPPPQPSWVSVDTGTDASLRGLSAVDGQVAWASGTGGTVLRTEDGGATWNQLADPSGEALDFRDVEAFDATTAVLMTAGQPARFYRTEDGGVTYSLSHQSSHTEAFFDSMAFWDTERGLAYSDPVDGHFLVLETADGGRSWNALEVDNLPPPREGEAGFAASGSMVAVGPDGLAWIGTGGSAARVLRTEDFGATWEVFETPVRHDGEGSAGIFSIAFRDGLHGLAAGGDYRLPEDTTANLAWTADGGATWTLADPPPSGHRAAVVSISDQPTPSWITVGRAGSDLSRDDGHTWERFSDTGYYALSVGNEGTVWAVGSEGRAGRLKWGTGGTN